MILFVVGGGYLSVVIRKNTTLVMQNEMNFSINKIRKSFEGIAKASTE